ncbi:conserved hypothetical protein [Sporisorium reilianum SRZ2]|uniref:ATPase, vacuolar ER assembly factor, Vma12 n=1 Tax=Sporisorium reilianum (strain SRZ2) TaxID=999809 RepID=E6ZRS3_SPORE|nr:conserved hypothetical protein [Sporisorium reilianum SRZ2]
MTKLTLSTSNSRLLRQLALQSDSEHDAVQTLRAALNDQPAQPKMTAASAAVPTSSTATDSDAPVVLDHTILVRIASWAQGDSATTELSVDKARLKLSALVTGSRVYIPPKPVFERSKQLEESLAAIKRAQEQAEYQRMSTTSASTGYKIPTSYVNIAGVDPTLSLHQRISSHAASPHLSSSFALLGQSEEQAWKDAQRQLSVILNIFLSALATATAAWWASGTASVGNKVLASMLVALVTAVAEIVLYSRYSVYVSESKKIKSNRMKGSDVKAGLGEFRPLQLDSGSKSKTQPAASSKEPS